MKVSSESGHYDNWKEWVIYNPKEALSEIYGQSSSPGWAVWLAIQK